MTAGKQPPASMAVSRYSFDVETRHGSRWVLDSTLERDYPAQLRAKALFSDPACEGARIIRTWLRPDGVTVDTEIFCQTRTVRQDDTLRASPVETVRTGCQTLKDFLGFESRQTMARIFRTYIARITATPTEILYNLRLLKRINEKDQLVRTAIDMVATLQADATGQDQRIRRDELYEAVDQAIARARQIDPADLPKLDRPIGAIMASLSPDKDVRNTQMLAALARDLTGRPSWASKLDLLCQLAEPETDPEALTLLDGVIADVLSTDILQEILGAQPALGTTIAAMLDLADGIPPTARSTVADITAPLARLLAAGKLPQARHCLIDRAHRAIRLPTPLVPHDPAQDQAAFAKLITRLLTPTGLHTAPDTAQALTARYTRMVEPGGKTGRRMALAGVFEAMPDLAYATLYLCDVAASAFAKDHLADMAALFAAILAAPDLAAFCQPGAALDIRLARATAAYHATAASPYPEDLRAKVTAHIDDLLERFVEEAQIIDHLDDPAAHLRDRALRLIQFCESGLLPPGKALKRTQGRVLGLLRQPDFPTRFVAGIKDPATAQAALRDFFERLKRSGLYAP